MAHLIQHDDTDTHTHSSSVRETNGGMSKAHTVSGRRGDRANHTAVELCILIASCLISMPTGHRPGPCDCCPEALVRTVVIGNKKTTNSQSDRVGEREGERERERKREM